MSAKTHRRTLSALAVLASLSLVQAGADPLDRPGVFPKADNGMSIDPNGGISAHADTGMTIDPDGRS